MSNENIDDADQFKKLFIGGLNIETTDESLRSFYERWGEVVDCIVMKDKITGRSKCFGFVTFGDAEIVDKCMAERPHIVDNKQVDPKRAMPRKDANKSELHQAVKKIFIGGLRDPLDENEIRDYFSKFGNIVSVDMVTDKITGKSKGFCFLTYDDTDSVDKVVLLQYHTVKDVRVEVKKAVDKDVRMGTSARGRGGMFMPRGGMPSARGGRFPARQDYGAPTYPGGYGSSQGGYGNGEWEQNSSWNQGFNYGYGGNDGYPMGSGYGGHYGGGAMKNNRHGQRTTAPYGNASYGGPAHGPNGNQKSSYGSYTPAPGAYGNACPPGGYGHS